MDSYSVPSSAELRDYLQFQGWAEHPPGPGGALWSKNGAQVGVPFEPDESIRRGVVERVAKIEDLPPRLVARTARYLMSDITYLRAANDHLITDTIPLETAASIIASGRTMFRAAGTTARRERAQIGGSYSPVGDEVVRDARMGHTEKGSFVIPVLVLLPRIEPRPVHEQHLFDRHDEPELHRVQPEPFERRVVRTFAQSMQAVSELVVEPAREPTAEQTHELVYRGVSREFCSALANVLGQRAVGSFETKIDWAPGLPAPATMANAVTIESGAVDLVQRVADKLRQQKVAMRQLFSGVIIQLRHEHQDDPYGEISISTIRRGRPTEIRVRLPMDLYRQAWDWHDDARAVLVEGTVRRAPGRQPIVDRPRRCHPVDEMHLGGEPRWPGGQ